jgi:hypothetical protein
LLKAYAEEQQKQFQLEQQQQFITIPGSTAADLENQSRSNNSGSSKGQSHGEPGQFLFQPSNPYGMGLNFTSTNALDPTLLKAQTF